MCSWGNVQSGKYPLGEMSSWRNVQSGKQPLGEMSGRENVKSGDCRVGEVSVGEVFGRLPDQFEILSRQCLSIPSHMYSSRISLSNVHCGIINCLGKLQIKVCCTSYISK